MKSYEIYLEDFCEEIFHEMERIQDGKQGHVVEFIEQDKDACAKDIAKRLIPFIANQLELIED